MSNNNRIDQLSKRFSTHAVGRRGDVTKRRRATDSIYVDIELLSTLGTTHRELSHELHPLVVSKSEFLETVLQFGLDHLDKIKAIILLKKKQDEPSF
jgi:hypothetical protein